MAGNKIGSLAIKQEVLVAISQNHLLVLLKNSLDKHNIIIFIQMKNYRYLR